MRPVSQVPRVAVVYRFDCTKHKQLFDFSSVLLLKDTSARSLKPGFDIIAIFARVNAIAACNDR